MDLSHGNLVAAPGKKECSPPLTGSPRRQEGGVPRELQGTALGLAPMEEVTEGQMPERPPATLHSVSAAGRAAIIRRVGLRPFLPPILGDVWRVLRDWGLTDVWLVSELAALPGGRVRRFRPAQRVIITGHAGDDPPAAFRACASELVPQADQRGLDARFRRDRRWGVVVPGVVSSALNHRFPRPLSAPLPARWQAHKSLHAC